MLVSRVSYRFAKALLQLSVERNELSRVIEDIKCVHKTSSENRELRIMFESPVIKTDKKRKIFRQIFESSLSLTTVTFFDIIFRRGREKMIFEISQSFIDQFKEFQKIHTVIVESASILNEENRKSILDFLKSRTTDKVELEEKINPELIGGVILRMNDLQIDASVRNSLNKLEKEFSKDLYSAKL